MAIVTQADDGNLTVKLLNVLTTGATSGADIVIDDDAEFFSLPSSDGLIIAGKNPTGTPNIIRRSATGTNPPIFLNMIKSISDGEWSLVGSGVWSRVVSTNIVGIWANGNSGYWGLTNGLKEVSGTPVSDFEFRNVSSSIVHVYTGSNFVAPPTYYNGLYMNKSAACAIGFTNNSNMTVTGICGAGGRVGFAIGHSNVASIGTPTQDQFNIVFTDPRGDRSFSHGVAIDMTSGSFKNRNIDVIRPYAEGGLTASTIGGLQQISGAGNGINIAHSYDNINITDYTAKHWGHSQMQNEQETGYLPGTLTMRAGANYGVLDGEFCKRSHCFGVNGGTSGQHTNPGFTYLSGMKVRKQSWPAHATGRCVISGFTMKEFQDVVAGSEQGSGGIDWGFNGSTIRPIDVTIEVGYIENSRGYPISAFEATSGLAADLVKVRHLTIVDVTYRGDTTYRSGTSNNASCSLRVWTPGHTPNDQIIEYNNFIVSGGDGQQLISWNNTDGGTNKFTINGKTEVTANNIENIEGYADRIGGDYRVTSGGGLYQTGTTANANARDVENDLCHTPASIGPRQLLYSDTPPEEPPIDGSPDRYDDFNRANSTSGLGNPSDGGSAWVTLSGTPGISGNKAYHVGASSAAAVKLDHDNANVEVSAILAQSFSSVGILGRIADNNNYILLDIQPDRMGISKKVAGTYTQIALTTGLTITTNDKLTLRMDSANLLSGYQNGVLRVSGTDSAGSANTDHGLNWNEPSLSPRWNNFTITNISAAAPETTRLGGLGGLA